MKKFLAFTMAAALTLSLAACGSSGGSSGSGSNADNSSSGGSTSGTAFKLGGTGPLTGDASIYGLAAQRGAQIAVEEINAEGGAIQFELKYEDDVNDPEKAVNAYNALKEWGMQISLGSVTTQPGIATSSYNFADSIFALTPSASSPDVISGKDNVYQMCFSDPNQGTASAKYISEQKLGEKVFIIWKSDDNYSTGIKDKFVAEAETLGLNVVSNATFTTDSKNDFTVQLTQAKQAGADLLFLPIYYDAASLILTQANAMGYEPKFFGVDGMDGILTQANFDTSLAEGVMLLTPFNADDEDEATQHFVKAYQDKYGETPIQFAADAYDCVYAYKQALETAGCTPDMSASELNEKLKATFPTITFTGLTGDGAGITWDATGAVSKSPKGMVIKDGAYVGMD
ncbi:ABC transporter substrate-binding protein [Pseudoflavonifractor phocaeensis]|uniref:ABC transporter substrate-binding protein n=1 Tax=Pseudoflavonifractor phocaeensis TaxID=1870988 RepID=UPI0025A48DAE|nr:ABC transporter substrate-binding protein [Pseudoflavonifractor phocaeensis]MDM8238948.1 ABC transporter substrate-binding protein [Pseudoflavonifractor phocaeensis]